MALHREGRDKILHEPPVRTRYKKCISLALANTNIQYKQINYDTDTDNIDNNK